MSDKPSDVEERIEQIRESDDSSDVIDRLDDLCRALAQEKQALFTELQHVKLDHQAAIQMWELREKERDDALDAVNLLAGMGMSVKDAKALAAALAQVAKVKALVEDNELAKEAAFRAGNIETCSKQATAIAAYRAALKSAIEKAEKEKADETPA